MMYLFTHTDLDGAGCRLVFDLWHYNTDVTYQIFNCGNNSIDEDLTEQLENINNEDTVYIADICPSIDVLKRLKETGCEVRIYDHHKTNLYAKEVFPYAVIVPTCEDSWECGTSLMYNALKEIHKFENEKIMDAFVDAVRKYDTFQFVKTGESYPKRLQTLFYMLGMDEFCSYYGSELPILNRLIPEHCDMFISARLKQEQEAIDKFIEEDNTEKFYLNGYRCAFIIGTNGANISTMANQYLTAYPEIDVFVCYFPSTNIMSFRTVKDDINVGTEFAIPLDGGGHPKAAGATAGDDFKQLLYSTIYDCLKEIYLRR